MLTNKALTINEKDHDSIYDVYTWKYHKSRRIGHFPHLHCEITSCMTTDFAWLVIIC